LRRALPLAAALCLLLPAGAAAKGGVIFEDYPDVQAVGAQMKFTAMLMDDRSNPMRPIEGVRPLVTFRDAKMGTVARVRASRSDLNGISYGTVALPAHGPWATEIRVRGRVLLPGDAQPFRVGVGLTQTTPPAPAARPVSHGERAPSESPAWPWIAVGAVASALLVLGIHHRRRWGAA
jgi:hypothetical protein